MTNIQKLRRMITVEKFTEGHMSWIDAERIRAMMIVWEYIEDHLIAPTKERIEGIFGKSAEERSPGTIMQRVKELLAERGVELPQGHEWELEVIAENISGHAIDFYGFRVIQQAVHSRHKGQDGEPKSRDDPLTSEELEGMTKLLVVTILNTLDRLKDDENFEERTDVHAVSVANLLSLHIWDALLLQQPRLVAILRYVLHVFEKEYPTFLAALSTRLQERNEGMWRALFDIDPVPGRMQQAVKLREQGGPLGTGKTPEEPLSPVELEGLTQNLAQVVFLTFRGVRSDIRGGVEREEYLRRAQSIANQLSRPRWQSILAQAPEMVYFLRTTLEILPRQFRATIEREMGDRSPEVEQAIFGKDTLDATSVLRRAA